MTIRKANESDATRIAELADMVRFDDAQSEELGERGFLMFVLSEEEYVQRVKQTQDFIVAEEDGTVIGFALAYDLPTIKLMGKEQDGDIKKVIEHSGGNNFLYIDQMVVDIDKRGKGVGQQLLDYLKDRHPQTAFYATIAVIPVENKCSLRFFVEKNKWKHVGNIVKGHAQGSIYMYKV